MLGEGRGQGAGGSLAPAHNNTIHDQYKHNVIQYWLQIVQRHVVSTVPRLLFQNRNAFRPERRAYGANIIMYIVHCHVRYICRGVKSVKIPPLPPPNL